MSSTKHSRLLHMQSIVDDDDDDGRRSVAHTHSTCTDEMFIFISSKCKYFVYTFILSGQKNKKEKIETHRHTTGACIFETVYKHTQQQQQQRIYVQKERSSCQGPFSPFVNKSIG